MPKFRKKPVVIDAVVWTGDLVAVAGILIGSAQLNVEQDLGDSSLYIPTLEGRMEAKLGDYIIKGVEGELYPCKPHIFQATYEPVE